MYNIKFEYAQQAQVVYTFKHIQVNLMKTNAAIQFNKKSKKPSTNTKIHGDWNKQGELTDNKTSLVQQVGIELL